MDPVSPYLFVLATEILAEAVRSIKEIEGTTLFEQEHKIYQYAVNTTLSTKLNETSFRSCMLTLKAFELVS